MDEARAPTPRRDETRTPRRAPSVERNAPTCCAGTCARDPFRSIIEPPHRPGHEPPPGTTDRPPLDGRYAAARARSFREQRYYGSVLMRTRQQVYYDIVPVLNIFI